MPNLIPGPVWKLAHAAIRRSLRFQCTLLGVPWTPELESEFAEALAEVMITAKRKAVSARHVTERSAPRKSA